MGVKEILTKGVIVISKPPCIEMVLLVVLLFLWFHHTAYQLKTMMCAIPVDPLPIPHQFSQPGDIVIGGITSHIFFFHETFSYTEQPTLGLTDELS